MLIVEKCALIPIPLERYAFVAQKRPFSYRPLTIFCVQKVVLPNALKCPFLLSSIDDIQCTKSCVHCPRVQDAHSHGCSPSVQIFTETCRGSVHCPPPRPGRSGHLQRAIAFPRNSNQSQAALPNPVTESLELGNISRWFSQVPVQCCREKLRLRIA